MDDLEDANSAWADGTVDGEEMWCGVFIPKYIQARIVCARLVDEMLFLNRRLVVIGLVHVSMSLEQCP